VSDHPLWTPSPERRARTRLTAFMREIEDRHRVSIPDYKTLYEYSLTRVDDFWRAMWDFGEIRGTMGERAVEGLERMPGAKFFPDATLNFAENMLRSRDDRPAIIFNGEGQRRSSMTFRELSDRVAQFANALRREGIRQGDRVAAYVPNFPEAIVAVLGTAAVGAVWSSCSPDFGVQGVLDRFGQIAPRILITADGYFYGGKEHDLSQRLQEIRRGLPSVERTVVVPYLGHRTPTGVDDTHVSWNEFLNGTSTNLEFEPLPFNHPLYILYSSGTTGVPKCIVHGAGGTLISHLKEHQLHSDIQAGDRVFYFTTCGWMMWNWLVSALASNATLVLYDGSPFHPDGNVLFDYADDVGMTLFGTSAKFIDAVAKAGLAPARTHRLETVRTITSTGSPLVPERFDFVYESIKRDVHLASISGGTDIVGLFAGGNPNGPVWRGELQVRTLGMKVEVFDERGQSLQGEKGELVCTLPFPSMPVSFWNDPDGRKYHAAYFEKFPGIWCHGDYVELTEHDGLIIYGRSDAVLNPGGVRIGTAEIYRQVEQFPEIVDSVVIGQHWENDERVVLFLRLRDGVTLDAELERKLRAKIRENTSPRHVPAKIVQVTDVPRTKSGKIVELAVRDIVHGREIKNKEALANPEALEQFRNRPELAS
jgi:acetoacetyl-CoA synthetase